MMKKMKERDEDKDKESKEIPLERKIERILKEDPRKRYDLILDSEDAPALVRSMPLQDLFLTVKDKGVSDSLQVIELAAPTQIQFMLDMEVWPAGRLSSLRLLRWLEILMSCESDIFERWLADCEIELLAWLLKKHTVVYKTSEGTDVLDTPEDRPDFTLDNVYFIRYENATARPILERILREISMADRERYHQLMEMAQWDLSSEMEEVSRLRRFGRLEDLGFPDPRYVEEIYTFIPLSFLKKLPLRKEKKAGAIPPETGGTPRFPLALPDAPRFVDMVLKRIEDTELMDSLSLELAAIANKILTADKLDTGDPDAAKKASKKTLSYINTGLEYLSGGDLHKGIEKLSDHWLLHLFQAGYSLVLALTYKLDRLERDGWPSKGGWGTDILDSPFRERLEGLSLPRPLYYDPSAAPGEEYREFTDYGEVRRTEEALITAEVCGKLLMETLCVVPPGREDLSGKRLYPKDPDAWRLSAFLLTAMANLVLDRPGGFRPLSPPDISRFLGLAMEKKGLQGRLKGDVREGFQSWILDKAGDLIEEEEKIIGSFTDYSIARLEEELGGLDPDKPPDPRFITCIFIKDERG